MLERGKKGLVKVATVVEDRRKHKLIHHQSHPQLYTHTHTHSWVFMFCKLSGAVAWEKGGCVVCVFLHPPTAASLLPHYIQPALTGSHQLRPLACECVCECACMWSYTVCVCETVKTAHLAVGWVRLLYYLQEHFTQPVCSRLTSRNTILCRPFMI